MRSMARTGVEWKKVYEELKRARDRDYHFLDGKVLGSMCTAPHPVARRAHMMFIETNLGNPGLYPGTEEIARKTMRMLGSLLHHKGYGHILSGGTEANITALWLARKLSKKSEVIFSENAHFSFLKASDLLGLKPVIVPLNKRYETDVDQIKIKFSNDTAAVVSSAGTTELGLVDDVETLSELCEDKCFLHVDAAFGGFVLPFLKELGYNVPRFDFELKGVSTLTVDPHKMGLSTIPAGALLVRESKWFNAIAVPSPYLTAEYQTSLAGTRCSAAVAATYAVMRVLGTEGYLRVVRRCMSTTYYLAEEMKRMGIYPVVEPKMNILGLKLRRPERVYEKLDRAGWKVSIGTHPKCLRIVMMPHVTKKVIDRFLPALKKACRECGEV